MGGADCGEITGVFFRKILPFHFQNFDKFDAATNVLQKVALPFLDAEACNVHFDKMNHSIQICSGAEKGMFHFFKFSSNLTQIQFQFQIQIQIQIFLPFSKMFQKFPKVNKLSSKHLKIM